MILETPSEPRQLRDWMQSMKRNQLNDPAATDDSYIVWAQNKLPKYLWDHWKNDLKPLDITWQKFMRILKYRTDVGVMWYQGTLPWPDFIKKITDLMQGPIGKEVSGKPSSEKSILAPQDAGAKQLAPISDWEKFERFCRDLWSHIWDNPELKRNGRRGQPQAGVDIYGDIRQKNDTLGGVQCKRRDAFADSVLTKEELRKIVKDAKRFKPNLRRLVIAYTGKSDVALQEEARKLTAKNQTKNLFSVEVASWDDIVDMVGNYPELLEQYELVATGASIKVLKGIDQKSDSMLQQQAEQFATTTHIAQNMRSLGTELGAIKEISQTIASGGELASEYSNEIDEIRDLLNSNHPKEALDRVITLEKRLPPNVVHAIKFRITTNKAAALAAIGDEEQAGLLFIQAFQYNPSDEKALCNKALGHIFLEQRKEALNIIEDVLKNNPMSQRAYEVLIYAANPDDSLESVIEKIPEILRKKDALAFAIAQAARLRGRKQEFLEWMEIAFKDADPGKLEPDLKGSLGSAILLSFEKEFGVQVGIQLTSENRKKLERAVTLLDDAIKVLEHSESLRYRTEWVSNRSVAHKLLGNIDKALNDAELTIKLQPDNPTFLKQKAYLLHEQGKTEEAITILKKIIGNPKAHEVSLLLAGILHEQEKDKEAIPILEASIRNTDKDSDLLSEEKRLLIHTYMRTKKYDLARSISDELRSTNPGSVTDLVIAARIEKRANNLTAHARLLDEARSYVTDSLPNRGVFELADELYVSKRYTDAWPIYEQLIDPRSGSPLTKKLIYSYYQAEVYDKALEAAKAMPEQAKDRFIYEIEVSILDIMDDLKGAIEILERYISKHPEDLAFKIRWATGLFRDNQIKKLDDFLNSPIDLSQLPEDVRFSGSRQLAWLYSKREMPLKALEVAYQLRKNTPRSGDAHMTYIGIFFDREKAINDILSPTEVGQNTAVYIEENGTSKQWHVIEESPGTDKNALSPNDPFAKRLIGGKVNDVIIQDKGKPSENIFKILEIKSKYVHALHESMALFPKLYTDDDNPPLKRFTIKTDPSNEEQHRDELLQILDTTAQQSESVLKVQKLYEEGKLTIGTFSNLIGRSPITVWGGLTNNSRIGVRCCAGTEDERQEALKLVRENEIVAVDLIALLTNASIDSLPLLRRSFKEILISQSTIDDLTKAIDEKTGLGSEGFMTVWKENGKYYHQEVPAEAIKKQVAFLKKIKKWVKDNCVPVPVNEILKLSKEERENLYQTMGESFVNTILIAKERACPLLTDDQGIRAIAQNDFGVKGFWTQALAITGREREFLNPEELEKINVALCSHNYRHTTISSHTLFYAAKATGWANTRDFTIVLAGITGPGIELRSAVNVAIEFFYQLWKEPTLSDLQRESLVFAVLDAIAQQKNRLEILRYAGALIPIRFKLVPIAGDHLLKLVAAWRSIRT